MSTKKLFTEQEMAQLKENPYTWKITENRIVYTRAFLEAFWELSLQGKSGTEAFRTLGYDPKVLGNERIHNTTKRIRKQGNSPEGIQKKPTQWMRTSKKRFKTADLEKLSHKQAAKRMQKEIVYLQQQVEFLKKVMHQDGIYKTEQQ